MPPLYSPGAEAVDSIFAMLAEREKAKQQQFMNQRLIMQDQIAQAREARLEQADAEDRQLRRETLQQQMTDRAAALADKQRTEARQEVDDRFLPGDIATSQEDVDLLKRAGARTEVVNPNAQGPVQPGQAPLNAVVRVLGNAKQRAADDLEQRQQAFYAKYSTPEGRQAAMQNPLAVQAEARALKLTIPEGAFAPPKSDTKDVYTLGRNGQIVNKVTVPATAQVERETFAPAGASGAVSTAQAENSYNHRVAELNALAKPWEAQMTSIETAENALSQGTAQADAQAAPALIKAMGNNRFTEAERKSIMGARSVWDSFGVALSKLDGTTVGFSPTQRRDAQRLLAAEKKNLSKKLAVIDKANGDLIDAGDNIETHKRIVAGARKELNDNAAPGFSVSMGGKTYHFKSQAELDAFKADAAAAGFK